MRKIDPSNYIELLMEGPRAQADASLQTVKFLIDQDATLGSL